MGEWNSMDQEEMNTTNQNQPSPEESENLWPNENWTSEDWEHFFAEDEEERPPRFKRWIISVLGALVLLGFIGVCIPVVTPRLFDNMDFLNQNVKLNREPMVEKARQAVVGIMVAGMQPGSQRSGTGFGITRDGWILTNMHVVKGARSIKVTLENGQEYYAVEYHQLKSYDIAAVKIKTDNLPCLTINHQPKLKPGDKVTVVGNPLGFMRIAVRGPVLAVHQYNPGDSGSMLEIAAEIRSGSSGSPIINDQGEVVGIVFGIREYSAGEKRASTALGLSLDLITNQLVDWGIRV